MQLWRELAAFKGDRRIALLEAVATTGSITRAAQHLGMAYKTAWDTLEALHNLSPEPLLRTQTGGRHGGGSALTAAGLALVEHYRRLEAELQARLPQEAAQDPWRRLRWQTSARNHFLGRIDAVYDSGLECDLSCTLAGGQILLARITRASWQRMALQVGREVHLMFKATAWCLAAQSHPQEAPGTWLQARVEEVTAIAEQIEMTLAGTAHQRYYAVCAAAQYTALALQPGAMVWAFCPASAIILGTYDEMA